MPKVDDVHPPRDILITKNLFDQIGGFLRPIKRGSRSFTALDVHNSTEHRVFSESVDPSNQWGNVRVTKGVSLGSIP
ncbi:hypothetical protein GCM10009304_30300 [Pseudomonas matsuisoli]|uniref:Uncharacterized protein n=1 Tax=Pseudomonas matsuisoli TaxID=1515666 RepID=A0A917Q0G5_9PSED|nr:hypothetical protein GCM10009304_30300 [Pseudomonas matsuisoli]